MSQNTLSAIPVVEPFAGGVLGLGLGYSLAPGKYSLKKLLVLKPHRLSNIYTNNVVQQMSPEEKHAMNNILTARDTFTHSRLQNREEFTQTAKIWQNLFRKIEVPTTLQETYRETRKILTAAIKQEDYINLNKQFREAKKAASLDPENPELQKALLAANEKLAMVKVRLTGKIENYRNTLRNIQNERLYLIRTNPSKYIETKEAYKNFMKARAKCRTIASNKLFELANNKSLLKNYKLIKEYIPKARTKFALIGGFITGGITSLITLNLNKNVNRV